VPPQPSAPPRAVAHVVFGTPTPPSSPLDRGGGYNAGTTPSPPPSPPPRNAALRVFVVSADDPEVPEVAAEAARQMATTLHGVLPQCCTKLPTRGGFEQCFPGILAMTSLEEKLAAVKAMGVAAVMEAMGCDSLTPSGFLLGIAQPVGPGISHTRAFLEAQVRDSDGVLLLHFSDGLLCCIHRSDRACRRCRRSKKLQPTELDWRRAILDLVVVADRVLPLLWTEESVAALAHKYLFVRLDASLMPSKNQWTAWLPTIINAFKNRGGVTECWSGRTRGVHRREAMCCWCNGGGQLEVCKHVDGSSHSHPGSNVPHYQVHALLAVHPRPVPAFRHRDCWLAWVADRWLTATNLPAATKRWLLSSTLFQPGRNSIAAVDLCDALADHFPGLRRWREVLTANGGPRWEDVSATDCATFLDGLRHPSPTREGMESIVASLMGAARRCAAALSFHTGGTERPFFDSGTLFKMARATRDLRQRFVRKLVTAFGSGHAPVECADFSSFCFGIVSYVCRWAPSLSVFPVPADVAVGIAAVAVTATAAVNAAAVARAIAECATPPPSSLNHNYPAESGDEEAGSEEEAGGAVGKGAAGGGDENDEDDEEETAAAELLPPELVRQRLRNPRMRIAPGVRVEDLLRWFNLPRPLLVAHGSLPSNSASIRRWGLLDPIVRLWTRSGVPPGCCAVYVSPVLNELTVAFSASFVIQRHARLNGGAQLPTVEVFFFLADPDVLYAQDATIASPYVWGGLSRTGPYAPAIALLNQLQLRAGRWVNFCMLNGMQVVRFIFVHPVAAECDVADAILGDSVDIKRSVGGAFGQVGPSNVLKPVASMLFDVASAND